MAKDTFHQPTNDLNSSPGDEERTTTSEMAESLAEQPVEREPEDQAEPAVAGPLPTGETSEEAAPAPGRVAVAEPARRPWWKRLFEGLLRRKAQEVVEVEAVPIAEAVPPPPEVPLPEPPSPEEEALDVAAEEIEESVPAPEEIVPEEVSLEKAPPATPALSPSASAACASKLGINSVAGPPFTLDDVRTRARELAGKEVARAQEELPNLVREELTRAQEEAYGEAQAELAHKLGEHHRTLLAAIQDLVYTVYDAKIASLRVELATLPKEERRIVRNNDLSLQERMEGVDYIRARIAQAEQAIAELEEAAVRQATKAARPLVEPEGHGLVAELRQELEWQKEMVTGIEDRAQQTVAARASGSRLRLWPTLLALLAVVTLGAAGILLPRQTGPAPTTLVEMATLYQVSGETEEAIRVLDEAVEAGIRDAERLGQVGQTYYALKEYEKAVEVLEQAVEQAPQNEEIHLALARSYGKAGQAQQATAQYERLIEMDPDNWRYYLGLGRQYEALQDYDQAFAQYRKVVELAPERVDGYTSQGNLYRDLERHDAAIPAYQRALEIKPNVSWIRVVLGQSYAELQIWDRAIEQFRAAMELAPDTPSPYLETGEVWRAQGEYEEALSWYQNALDVQPDHVPTLLEMGDTYVELEDCEQATLRFLRVLEIQPNNKVAQDGLEACQGE
jgi:tetratricopeptide (TPR) repeat protein